MLVKLNHHEATENSERIKLRIKEILSNGRKSFKTVMTMDVFISRHFSFALLTIIAFSISYFQTNDEFAL